MLPHLEREPTPPGSGRVKSACAVAGSAKTLPPCLKKPVFGLAVICVIAARNQSVGQRWPPSTLKGKPLVQRTSPGKLPAPNESVQKTTSSLAARVQWKSQQRRRGEFSACYAI